MGNLWIFQCGLMCVLMVLLSPTAAASVPDDSIQIQSSDTKTVDSIGFLPQPPYCGKFYEPHVLSNDGTTLIDEFPWMALIEFSEPGYIRSYNCAGVLINNRYVLTAAHCVIGKHSPNLFSVRLGETNAPADPDCSENNTITRDCAPEAVEITVEETIAYPKYCIDNFINHDIALLRLSHPVNYTDYIRPICLASSVELSEQPMDKIVQVIRWDRVNMSESNMENQKVNLEVKNFEDCKESYARKGIALTDRHICTNGKLNVGDSGTPLVDQHVVENSSYHYLVGLASFAIHEAPTVFTSVSPYVEWIRGAIRD